LDDKLYSNDAVSRKERMQLAYLASRITSEYFHRGLPPKLGRQSFLEDALVEYLKTLSSDGVSATQTFLRSSLAEFPERTLESSYLQYLLQSLPKREGMDG
jgi:hypothetical protein